MERQVGELGGKLVRTVLRKLMAERTSSREWSALSKAAERSAGITGKCQMDISLHSC